MSLLFAGDNSSYITIDSHTDFQVGTGEFTIEWFQYRTDSNPNTRIFTFGNYPNATLGVSIEGNMFYLWANKSFILNVDIGNHKEQWIHFAITRDRKNIIKIFKNGQTLVELEYTETINNSENMSIGIEETDDTAFGGYLTNIRFTKKALYTADFSTPIAPLFNTTESVLLILAHKENILNYASTTLTITNNTEWNSLSPFTSNVLSLTTNTSQSFVKQFEDPLNPMSPSINKWNDFSSFNSTFILTNTTLSDGVLSFSRENNSIAVQSQEILQTRSLTNLSLYGWVNVDYTNGDILTILLNRNNDIDNTQNIYGIESRGAGDYRLRWNNKLIFINQQTSLTLPNNNWCFVGLTVNTTDKIAKMYLKHNSIDESFIFSGETYEEDLGISPIDLSNIMIGGNTTTRRSFNGSMKTLQMFNAVLSDAQIQEQYLLSGQQLGFILYDEPEHFIPPFTPMDTPTLTKKILNERTNQSLFSLLNHSSNRILPQNNFLPTQSASSSERLRKLKLQNHISANHR